MSEYRILRTFGRYLRDRFGENVAKISLSAPNFTCPNIDGALARGGCAYCSNETFSPHLAAAFGDQKEAILRQYRESETAFKRRGYKNGKNRVKTAQKSAKKFIAYFQSYSNTYAEVSRVAALHEAVLAKKNCVGISIGTRADCIDAAMLDYLRDLNRRTHLWLEIGVQSAHDQTLRAINRQETFGAVAEKIAALRSRGVLVCAHLIFGLPNETREMILESVRRVAALGVNAVKIHPLHINKGTALARQNPPALTPAEYADLLIAAIRILPPEMIYQRISAGIDNSTLIAPDWCRVKNSQMAYLRRALLAQKIIY
ncbi:MAG: TIGR01212 family radical SAM protein [Helicobacteraceae bacterium]|nr:TIGR01212 family radical SAM protein [Helicobacteraceae bacterium]